MVIEYIEDKWWRTAGEGYPSTRIYREQEVWELVRKNNLICVTDEPEYKLYEPKK